MMKKFMRYICVILVCGLILTVPARAESVVDQRGSIFFAAYGTDLYKASSTSFEIWFDVDSNVDMMDVLGVSEITVYRSADQQSWAEMRTFYMENYPEMTAKNAYYHTGYVTYNYATPGYYYTAYITFYAKNSNGVGERYVYTEVLLM